MPRFPRFAILLAFFTLGLAALSATSASAAPRSFDVDGHVYINNNTAPVNTISVFDRHRDGSLSPTAGSPFATSGSGTGATTPSQGAIQFSDDHRYILAVDAGSDQVSVLRIRHDGGLDEVQGSPVSSNGKTPISIAVHDNLVYVANSGAGGTNYAGFVLNSGGHLSALPGAIYPTPDAPVDVLINGDGSRLAGTRVGGVAAPTYIDSFTVDRTGHLTAAPNSPFVAPGIGPFGSEFRPTNRNQLFVSIAHNGAGLGTIAAYSVSPNGNLNAVPGSPFPDGQTAPCWLTISNDGRFLYTVNTGTPSISTYLIAPNGSLSFMSSTPFNSAGGLRPFDIGLDPTSRFAYVVGASKVSAFRVSGATLTEVAGSPFSLPAGVNGAFGVAVD